MDKALVINHDRTGHNFEVVVNGHRAYLAYMDLGMRTLDIYRTFVPAEIRNRGIAAALAEEAIAYAENNRYSIIPSCSFVERYQTRRLSQN